ncbi:UBX domain-containing protein 11 [Petromyzon marinus]|uniref:UBX domain-containing protein 11 n=1 Tax=Petromyzon marinus TaxID=7757 RepID=UPI003F71F4B5
MSSPLAQLGRTRRAPLPEGDLGKRLAPFKARSSNTAQEEALVSGRLASPADRSLSLLLPGGAHVARGKLGKPPKGVPSDAELLSVMSTRLAQLEQRVKLYAHEIHDKDQKLRSAEEKVKSLERMRDAERDVATRDPGATSLRDRCRQLQEQLDQMEAFLRDYGLVWVGDAGGRGAGAREPTAGAETHGGSRTTAGSAARGAEGSRVDLDGAEGSRVDLDGAEGFRVDLDALLRHVRELNLVAGEGESQVERTAGGARLRPTRSVPLALYRNGMLMFGGPFRPYSDPATQECLQDIMDGYFPSELQGRYPDGVPFQVTDRRDEVFHERRLGDDFPGHGETLGGRGGGGGGGGVETSRLVEPRAEERSERSGRAVAECGESVDQFVSKLPTCVIKRGSVVSIRASVRSLLMGDEDPGTRTRGLITVETSVDRADREGVGGLEFGSVATLRVRSESGEERYLLRMEATQTITHLRAYLDTHSSRLGRSPRYELLSGFPPRVCDDASASLDSLGLVPTGTLLMRAAGRQATAARATAP